VVTTDDPAWYKPGYAEFIYKSSYARYLEGFAEPELIFGTNLDRDRLPVGLKDELKRRLEGRRCPVLAWSVHNMTPAVIGMIKVKLLRALDLPEGSTNVLAKSFHDGAAGYVLYVQTD
jgi:hypothetical protein